MDQVLAIISPIFLLIALGYLAGRLAWVGKEVTRGLTDFTFVLAIPAMLFHTMATASFPEMPIAGIWLGFFGSAALVWLLASVLAPLLRGRVVADTPFVSMSSAFGNVVMLGIPLSVATFGEAATAPVALVVSLHSALLWSLATLHYVLVTQKREDSVRDLVRGVVRDIVRNLIIVAVLTGSAWRLSGIGLNPVVNDALLLLGGAAIPCALVSLGLSLTAFQIRSQAATLSLILLLKNVVMPVIAWILCTWVISLPPLETGVVVLCAAMPTGANAYVFAARYGRAVNASSGAVALGVVLSVVTVAATIFALTTRAVS